jgi:hypothetical protein
MTQDDLEYHRQRARAEMDQAYRASSDAAAAAHMRLSALHMKCLQSEDEKCGGASVAQRA